MTKITYNKIKLNIKKKKKTIKRLKLVNKRK